LKLSEFQFHYLIQILGIHLYSCYCSLQPKYLNLGFKTDWVGFFKRVEPVMLQIKLNYLTRLCYKNTLPPEFIASSVTSYTVRDSLAALNLSLPHRSISRLLSNPPQTLSPCQLYFVSKLLSNKSSHHFMFPRLVFGVGVLVVFLS
jgi:hypothetical protein